MDRQHCSSKRGRDKYQRKMWLFSVIILCERLTIISLRNWFILIRERIEAMAIYPNRYSASDLFEVQLEAIWDEKYKLLFHCEYLRAISNSIYAFEIYCAYNNEFSFVYFQIARHVLFSWRRGTDNGEVMTWVTNIIHCLLSELFILSFSSNFYKVYLGRSFLKNNCFFYVWVIF